MLAFCNRKRVPVAVMYACDWLFDINYLFGALLFDGYSDLGNILMPAIGIAGLPMLFVLDPNPYRSRAAQGKALV